jgi:N-6 DNA Methylase
VNAVESIAAAAQATGYRAEALIRDYAFADVLDQNAKTRKVPLVAFTQTPPSYRSAALGVVYGSNDNAFRLVQEHRALGAPLLFVIDGDDVAIWQVRSVEPPRFLERSKLDELAGLFERNRLAWNPDAIHLAKSVGAVEKGYQLDFVDLGLLPAIEGEIHAKLDRLLVETLAAATQTQGGRNLDMRLLFRVVFRLLAAKVLQDRGHPYASNWDADDLPSILKAIESYYSLATMPSFGRRGTPPAFKVVWDHLRQGINFSNISADDLAFVYENTLVTPEARKLFGTHSTPRQVAEYVVQRLELHRHRPDDLNIYEPFAGAGIFLVSALRHVRDLLPVSWTDQQRHDFLVKHLAGDEIDSFACEVASLSLILADYPNHNGWHIAEADLFENDALDKRMRAHNVILCNPPFESFTQKDRARYPIAAQSYSKPVAVLDAALRAHPLALGFVLPRPFILEQQFVEQRRKIEKLYGTVELVELPDRTFGASVIDAAVLIATDPRPPATAVITLKSTEIAGRDRNAFLKTGETTTRRCVTRPLGDVTSGDLWIPPLALLWEYVQSYPRLGSKLHPSRGLEWTYNQSKAFEDRRQAGFRKGLHVARGFRQFVAPRPVWLDYREEKIRCGYGQDWDKLKLIVNAARVSRGPWRLDAALDTDGLLFSQQFYGLWPTAPIKKGELLALAAVLNGPLANAFIATHSPAGRIRGSAISEIPIPPSLPNHLGNLVDDYVSGLSNQQLFDQTGKQLQSLLAQIDAAVLDAYDLPPRLERELLDYFKDAERPVAHEWTHWDAFVPGIGLRLAERLPGRIKSPQNWISEVFRPLPENEAALLRDYGE